VAATTAIGASMLASADGPTTPSCTTDSGGPTLSYVSCNAQDVLLLLLKAIIDLL
jgi:hypothetical protein